MRVRRLIAVAAVLTVAASVLVVPSASARVTLHQGDGATMVYAPRDYAADPTAPSIACPDHIQGRYATIGTQTRELVVYLYDPSRGPYRVVGPAGFSRFAYDDGTLLHFLHSFTVTTSQPIGPDEGWGTLEVDHSAPFSETFDETYDENGETVVAVPGQQLLLAPQWDGIAHVLDVVDCRRPSAIPRAVTAPAGATTPITLAGTDPTGDPLTFAIVDPPDHGELGGTVPNVTYTPTPGYAGPDSFRFTVSDPLGPSLPATVSITVTPAPPTACAWGHRLEVSPLSLRFPSTPLAGATVGAAVGSPRVAIHLWPPFYEVPGARSVEFAVDGVPRSVESSAPYDLAGTEWFGLAKLFDTRPLAAGPHTVTATIRWRSARPPCVLTASFVVRHR